MPCQVLLVGLGESITIKGWIGHRSRLLGLQAGLGDLKHATLLKDRLELLSLVIEGNGANLSALGIKQIYSEELALPSGI